MYYTDQFYAVKEKVFKEIALKTNAPVSYRQKVVVLITVISLLKLLVAFVVPLGNDESYYWLYAQDIKWNYFDHPPMVAVWVRLFTLNLWLQDFAGFIRLGSIVACALSSWFMYQTVACLHSERAGWLAACLYHASYYAGITAGLLVIPDAPQLVFWTFSLWMIATITRDGSKWRYWILLGIAVGLCIMSKVHGVFIWSGLGLYVLLKERSWLAKPQLWTALAISIVIASPIVWWNLHHDFATYRFHSQRVMVLHRVMNGYSFLREMAGQFFFNNPFNVMLVLSGFAAWRRRKLKFSTALSIYNCIALPLILLLLAIALFRDTTLPHWSGPAYVTLLPLASIRLAAMSRTRLFPRWIKTSLGAFVLVLVVLTLTILFYPGTLGSKDPKSYGKGDLTLDFYGWEEAAQQFATQHQKAVRQGLVPANTSVVCYKWWGAHIEYFFCRPMGLTMIGMGNLNNLHEYQWLNKERKHAVNLNQAYCIVPADEYYDVEKQYAHYYREIKWINTIVTYRNGQPAHLFHVYHLKGWKGRLPTAQ